MPPQADLAKAFELLAANPAESEVLLRAVLARGDDPGARLMLATARRLQGDAAGAHEITQVLAAANPNWPGAQFEHGAALNALGRHRDALAVLQPLTRAPPLPGLWRELGDAHWALNEAAPAEGAYLRHLAPGPVEALVHQGITALQRQDKVSAEAALSLQLARYPADVLALRILAEVHSSDDRYEQAEALLRRLLERAPSFALARYGLAMVLFHSHRLPPALAELDALLAREPKRLEFLNLKADALGRLGDFEAAAAILRSVIETYPQDANAWANLGHILRALGKREECEAAYKRAIALRPGAGDAYWGLANLKTFRFEPPQIAAMEAQVPQASGEDKTALLFSLGAAREAQGQHAEAFAAYSAANAAHRGRLPHNADERPDYTRRAGAVFTADFFAVRQGVGHKARDPIFIVGMPRSGSTLVEQIVASHSAVEGTMELVELLTMSRRLGRDAQYPEMLREADPALFAELGAEYLERTRPFRKTDAPRFIDKMPNNFTQAGLIHLILPNATIIDVRRHPLACGFSIFKQHWASGQTFAYDLADIGAYYRAYVELMARIDAALPGRVHRVIYEELVADPEGETRKLITACGLEFEESCLRFYENKRAVRTPSSEQVRQPIYAGASEAWRPYEQWLGPLKDALGPVLDHYPEPPPL